MSLSCEECRNWLGALLEESGPAGSGSPIAASAPAPASPGDDIPRAEVEAHLAACSSCAQELAMLRRVRQEVRALPSLRAPMDLRSRIRAQLEQEAAAPAMVSLPAIPADARSVQPAPGGERRGLVAALLSFFGRPTNVVWTGGLAVAAICLLLLARPQMNNFDLSPEAVQDGSASIAARSPAQEPASAPAPLHKGEDGGSAENEASRQTSGRQAASQAAARQPAASQPAPPRIAATVKERTTEPDAPERTRTARSAPTQDSVTMEQRPHSFAAGSTERRVTGYFKAVPPVSIPRPRDENQSKKSAVELRKQHPDVRAYRSNTQPQPVVRLVLLPEVEPAPQPKTALTKPLYQRSITPPAAPAAPTAADAALQDAPDDLPVAPDMAAPPAGVRGPAGPQGPPGPPAPGALAASASPPREEKDGDGADEAAANRRDKGKTASGIGGTVGGGGGFGGGGFGAASRPRTDFAVGEPFPTPTVAGPPKGGAAVHREPALTIAPSVRHRAVLDSPPSRLSAMSNTLRLGEEQRAKLIVVPPLDVANAQVDVSLSAGLRFHDQPGGGGSRTVWRGAARASQPIEIFQNFVGIVPGPQQLKVELGENSQTIHRETITVNVAPR